MQIATLKRIISMLIFAPSTGINVSGNLPFEMKYQSTTQSNRATHPSESTKKLGGIETKNNASHI